MAGRRDVEYIKIDPVKFEKILKGFGIPYTAISTLLGRNKSFISQAIVRARLGIDDAEKICLFHSSLGYGEITTADFVKDETEQTNEPKSGQIGRDTADTARINLEILRGLSDIHAVLAEIRQAAMEIQVDGKKNGSESVELLGKINSVENVNKVLLKKIHVELEENTKKMNAAINRLNDVEKELQTIIGELK